MNILPKGKISVGQLLVVGPLLSVFLITVAWTTGVWMLSGDPQISARAWLTLAAGILVSVVGGCGLIALMFYDRRIG
jgi:hypothetical protein